jgi:hypothetical protein
MIGTRRIVGAALVAALRRPIELAIGGLLVFCIVPQFAAAQDAAFPKTRNAALRYWMAFALMQDPPADKGTQELLENVAEGRAPWNEPRLGPLIDQNTGAILTMQRATELPECNWGLEYDLGPETPLAHLAKARVMARLNVLYGMRSAAKHDGRGAVETWLAGLRFAQHLAQGGSLIGALTAKAALLADLEALTHAVENGSLESASLERIEHALQALPPYGFDWNQALSFEFLGEEMAMKQLAQSPDPKLLYKQWFGEAAPASFALPNPSVLSQWHNLTEQALVAFHHTSADTKDRLAKIRRDIVSLNPVLGEITPSLTRVEDNRDQLETARLNLLHAVAAQLSRRK